MQLDKAAAAIKDGLKDAAAIEDKLPQCAIETGMCSNPEWAGAWGEALRRMVLRLEKGIAPRPNSTAEELALHITLSDFDKSSKMSDTFRALPSAGALDNPSRIRDEEMLCEDEVRSMHACRTWNC